MIVSTALNFANNGQSVMFEAEDTDIFIMLSHHWKTDMGDMYLYIEGKSTQIVAVTQHPLLLGKGKLT